MKKLSFLFLLFCASLAVAQKSKLNQDKAAIKSLAGCYKVTFEFAETFAPDTAYQYMDRKTDWAIEYAFVVEETANKISLQHLLMVNDTMIIKHWRQDWIYENTELLAYHKNHEWKKATITPQQAKGTWTQKVYQVDDSPRYESYGTWVHVDGRHFWEGTGDAPLPRREATKPRLDYNVMKRHSHIELNAHGWILEQDNQKIMRSESGDKLICWEKGFETFTSGEYNCTLAIDYWAKNSAYWADVRKAWDDYYKGNQSLKFQLRVNDQMLFQQLFRLENELSKNYDSKKAIPLIKQTIDQYLQKG
jgi:hypothetical protein